MKSFVNPSCEFEYTITVLLKYPGDFASKVTLTVPEAPEFIGCLGKFATVQPHDVFTSLIIKGIIPGFLKEKST